MRKRIWGLTICAVLSAMSFAGGQQPQTTSFKWGDSTITGFSSYRATRTASGIHLIVLHGPNEMIHLTSPQRGIEASCGKVEGDLVKNLIESATFYGGVHVSVKRPSSNLSSGEPQSATASGEQAIYNGSANSLDITGGVNLTDEDTGANRSVTASGETANVILSQAQSHADAFRSASLHNSVKIDLAGRRIDSGKSVPYAIHATCHQATFDNEAHTIKLSGRVRINSDDPIFGGGASNVEQEIIQLAPDGSIESVEGTGEPGTDTVDLSTIKQ